LAIEIERKFLVLSMEGVDLPEGVPIDQGYLSQPGGITVRVRTKGSKGYLTIKTPLAGAEARESGAPIARHEFEYEIPMVDARALLDVSLARLQKTRYHLDMGIELDVLWWRNLNPGTVPILPQSPA